MKSVLVICFLVVVAPGAAVSPVQKVVELLDQCKAKVQKDLAAEAKSMEEYTTFCDDELTEKGFAIKTAERDLAGFDADIADNTAVASEAEDVIASTGSLLGAKSKDLYGAESARKAQNAAFVAAEKEMTQSVEELSGAANMLKGGGAAFLQADRVPAKVRNAVDALKTIVQSQRLDLASRKKIQSFLQAAENAKSGEDDSDFQTDLSKVAAPKASESILETVEEMQNKAEDSLSDLRTKEMKDVQSFEMVKQNLENEMKNAQDKLDMTTKGKASAEEKLASAQSDKVETQKSKSADEEYSATLKTQCEQTAVAWEARQKDAAAEQAAIEKAKEILVSGVNVLVQTKITTKKWGDDDAVSPQDQARSKVVDVLRSLARKHKSFALAQIASAASSDPFVKIRGLIEDMISKLVQEAQEEATHEAFCQEEMAKSKASKEEKTLTLEKHAARIEASTSTIAQQSEKVKTLEAEIAEIDKATAEATKVRAEENAEYKTAAADFGQAAEAVARAIEVLKNYYEGALLQVQVVRSRQPAFGGAKSDTGSSIISILEMAQEDFTTLLAETEEDEARAAKEYEKLSQENKVSRASKEAEAKASASEVKSVTVNLENYKEDHASVSAELDAVNSYIDKLKPECESKAMSYQERKAAREAEIEGLKTGLSILEGKGV